jgi:preprotein translocase subunit SecF
MELIKPGINVNFVGKMKMFFWFSITLTIVSLIYMIARGGPNMGIDFAGGTVVQVKYSQATSVDKIREALKPINLEGSVVQEVGSRSENEFLLRIEMSSADLKGVSDKIEDAMATAYGKNGFEIRRIEAVGPKAGKDLTQKGILAVCFSLLGMLIYISWRYEFRFALGGIIALVHDVIVSVAFFTILGGEFTLTIIAALLTIIGYSINDTVVVFDRIRENMRKSPTQELGEIINASINQNHPHLVHGVPCSDCAVLLRRRGYPRFRLHPSGRGRLRNLFLGIHCEPSGHRVGVHLPVKEKEKEIT